MDAKIHLARATESLEHQLNTSINTNRMKKQSNLAVFFGKVAHNCTEEIIHDLPREFEHYFDCIACFKRYFIDKLSFTQARVRTNGTHHGWDWQWGLRVVEQMLSLLINKNITIIYGEVFIVNYCVLSSKIVKSLLYSCTNCTPVI